MFCFVWDLNLANCQPSEKMKSRWSIFFIYGLMMNSVELSDSSGVMETCIKTFTNYSNSTAELLNLLSKSGVPFISRLDNDDFLESENCKSGDGRSCSFERLIGHFHAYVKATKLQIPDEDKQNTIQKIEVSLIVKRQDNGALLVEDLCKKINDSLTNSLPVTETKPCTTPPSLPVTETKPCTTPPSLPVTETKPCTTPPSLPCEAVCSTDKTTPAENQTSSTEKAIKQKEDSQVSYLVIASLASFLGGVLCTVFTLFVYRFKCHRKQKHGSRDGNIGFDDIHLKTKETAKQGAKQESGQTTYETLDGTKCAIVDNANADHVYLGLDVGSKYENVGENAQQAYNTVHLRHNLNNEVKTDHVYNVLKKEEATRVYEDTMRKHSTEHTYTGLTGQEPENRRVKYENTGAVSGSNDSRSSEVHNYFTLQDEDNSNTGDVTSVSYACGDHETHGVDMAGDNLSSIDHDYFTLHKTDQSNCPTAEIDQTDENIESEIYTLGHDYHTLETVEKEN